MAALDIQIVEVTKKYGDELAVDSVSLGVERGEFLTLLGPSGCGKTTTLNMIAGFVTPTAGSILIKDQSVTNLPAYERDTGMVFQSYALFPHMTVFDNVAFGLRMRRTKAQQIQQQVDEMLERVQLMGLEKRYPRQLSGGQQQRVALARAMVTRPAVLLLDEPLSNLDLKLREAMRLELKSLQRDLGITSVYVTHDQDEALAMSDRIAVMNAGKIEQLGAPEAIYESPRSLFVATFIGATNLLKGTVTTIQRQRVEVTLPSGGTLRTRSDQDLVRGEHVIVSVRPEKCYLSTVQPSSPDNHLRAQVTDVMVLGADLQYLLKLEGGETFLAKALNADGSLRPHRGDWIYVSLPTHHCLSFRQQAHGPTTKEVNEMSEVT
jgi:spermidine/putrescine transport system ATP-binding protein